MTKFQVIFLAIFLVGFGAFSPFEKTYAFGGEEEKNVRFNLSEGTWMSVDVSPDGQSIAFDLLNDIYVMPADGGRAVAIAKGGAAQHTPKYSPDGDLIAYISDESGASNIWVAEPDGSQPRQITFEKKNKIASPAWAPDGKSIAAVVTYSNVKQIKNPEIRIFPLDASGSSVIVPAAVSGRDIQEPVFSPDGEYIYYSERVAGDHYVYMNTALKNFEVKRRNVKKGESETFAAGFGGATTPQISPDGDYIAFIRRLGAKTALFTVDSDGITQVPVYDGLSRDLQGDYLPQEHYYPAFDWFPDNKHIAIWAKGKIHKVNTQTNDAEEIPFELTAEHVVHKAVRVKQNFDPDTIDVRIMRQTSLHPTDEKVLFRAVGGVWLQDLSKETSQATRLTAKEVGAWSPEWLPDGSGFAYIQWTDEEGSSLRLRDLKSGEETTLLSTRAVISEPRLSRNGKFLAYRILEPDASMSASRGGKPGLYVISLKDKKSKWVASGVKLLRFSPNDRRLFYIGDLDYSSDRLITVRSIGIDGANAREHAYAKSADISNIDISPDLRWLSFNENHLPHLAPFSTNAQPFEITAQGKSEVRRLGDIGAYDMTWAADSKSLTWMLGPDYYRFSPNQKKDALTKDRLSIKIPTDRPVGKVAFVGGRVIPIEGKVIKKGVVVVSGNKISAVGRKGKGKIPKDAMIVDISGKTIMPGFFDSHGHVDCCFRTGVMPIKQPTRYGALAYGVTTNFDPYSNDLTSYESAEMSLAGLMVSPRWLSSGLVLYGLSGRGDGTYHPINSYKDAKNLMERRKAVGLSVLKSYKYPTRIERKWILDAAREEGYMVDAEGAGQFYANISMLLDGHTNLEHNMPIPTYHDDLIQLYAASDMSMTPTLIVVFGELFGENYIYQNQQPWKQRKVHSFIPDVNNAYNPISGHADAPLHVRGSQTIHAADEIYDIGFRSVSRSVKKLVDAGVVVNAGSHGQAAGLALHWEMQLLAEGGVSNMDILRTATLNGAITYGLDHQLGSIEVGKLADLIVLDENPLEDIKNTNSVRYTMVNGRLYNSYTMNEIGNYDRPRDRFYWEIDPWGVFDWKSTWAGK